MSRFLGKTAIVTGASRGIGLAIAQRLVDNGARVVVTARKPDPLAAAVAKLGDTHSVGVAGHADDPSHQDEAIATALERFGSIDFLVNNTGINPAFGPLMNLDLDTARKTIDVNVLASLAWTQKAHHAWMSDHGGAVVNVSSIAGERPAPGIALYGGTKAMLTHLTKELAHELSPTIRVNAVAPAIVKTQFAGALYEGKEKEVAAPYPMKRLGTPDDIAGAVTFLLSEDAAWITGQLVVIDGGLSLTGGL